MDSSFEIEVDCNGGGTPHVHKIVISCKRGESTTSDRAACGFLMTAPTAASSSSRASTRLLRRVVPSRLKG
jgi:hypothetical protein